MSDVLDQKRGFRRDLLTGMRSRRRRLFTNRVLLGPRLRRGRVPRELPRDRRAVLDAERLLPFPIARLSQRSVHALRTRVRLRRRRRVLFVGTLHERILHLPGFRRHLFDGS